MSFGIKAFGTDGTISAFTVGGSLNVNVGLAFNVEDFSDLVGKSSGVNVTLGAGNGGLEILGVTEDGRIMVFGTSVSRTIWWGVRAAPIGPGRRAYALSRAARDHSGCSSSHLARHLSSYRWMEETHAEVGHQPPASGRHPRRSSGDILGRSSAYLLGPGSSARTAATLTGGWWVFNP